MKKYDIMVLSGGFDPVHKGHVRMFKAAKNMAHVVVVGINSDNWLVRKKGKAFMNFAERAEIIEAFRCVDEVMPFNDDDNSAMDLLVKVHSLYPTKSIAFGNGGDRTADNIPEKGFCQAYKIDLIFQLGGGKVQSSSTLIKESSTNNS
jgi:D-beta-D-heptose 7-phosphate kinase/D-beta-D-heptose 1-phosphate adenosyltransferase